MFFAQFSKWFGEIFAELIWFLSSTWPGNTTLLHYYTTALLHYYTTTPLHCYTTTLLHDYTTTLLRCTTTPPHYYTTAQLHHDISAQQRKTTTIFMRQMLCQSRNNSQHVDTRVIRRRHGGGFAAGHWIAIAWRKE